jgi:hypothetical protein
MPPRSKRRSARKVLSSRDKVRADRKRLRARRATPDSGLGTRHAHAAFKVHRQSLVVPQSPHPRQDQDFIDTISLQPSD